MSDSQVIPFLSELNRVDEAYVAKMELFRDDCDNGTGDPIACHHVGEFFSVVQNDRATSARIFTKNCDQKNHYASCFNLAKLYTGGAGTS